MGSPISVTGRLFSRDHRCRSGRMQPVAAHRKVRRDTVLQSTMGQPPWHTLTDTQPVGAGKVEAMVLGNVMV